MSETAPPGWYPDSSAPGFERWWDGSAWSHVTRPVEAGPTTPAPGWAAPTAPGRPGSSAEPGQGFGGPTSYGQTPDQPGQPHQWTQTQSYGAPQPYQAYPGQAYGSMDQAAVYFHAKRTPDGEPLAGVGMRLLARILDGMITGVLTLALSFQALTDYLDAVTRFVDEAAVSGDAADPFAIYSDPQVSKSLITITVVSFLVSLLYEVLFIGFLGATPGKLACGLRVRRYDRPGKPGWGPAILRWLVIGISGLVCGLVSLLDVLWCLWDPRRQCLHDKAASTVVVSKRPF
ncbi:MAG: RDD family protein [Kineosporiaceae bacterium]